MIVSQKAITEELTTEFRQMALQIHCHHSGRSVIWDDENLEHWKCCQYSFCRHRYELLEACQTETRNERLIIAALVERLSGSVELSERELRDSHFAIEVAAVGLETIRISLKRVNPPFIFDDNPAPMFCETDPIP